MKKILMLMLAMAFMMPPTASADLSKSLEKARNKECKAKIKEYKKEKWQLLASTHTMEVQLLEHYNRLAQLGEDGHVVAGIASRVKSKNIGKQMSANNACITYANEAGSSLKGRVVSDMHANGVDASSEFDNFYGAYERLLQNEIKGEMQESYSIYRENGDGTYEVQTYYIVSQSAASRARIRAMEDALKESEAAQKHADKIAKFVREGFENE